MGQEQPVVQNKFVQPFVGKENVCNKKRKPRKKSGTRNTSINKPDLADAVVEAFAPTVQPFVQTIAASDASSKDKEEEEDPVLRQIQREVYEEILRMRSKT